MGSEEYNRSSKVREYRIYDRAGRVFVEQGKTEDPLSFLCDKDLKDRLKVGYELQTRRHGKPWRTLLSRPYEVVAKPVGRPKKVWRPKE